MDKLYYTIGEVAGILGENVSLVRFWSDSFPKFIRPKRNAKGNRMFTPQDVEMFKQIHFLVRHCGLTLEGAAKKLQSNSASVAQSARILDSLKSMRAQLEEIRGTL
ncbi:MAG: MerR family transcriptional regulator [Bacteroidales bacterium]|nr:MerR family transcriptional regulator [Bacteroidales bacterium]